MEVDMFGASPLSRVRNEGYSSTRSGTKGNKVTTFKAGRR